MNNKKSNMNELNAFELIMVGGKNVYVSKENYRRISRLAGNDKVQICQYLDNVLAKHFARYGEAVAELLGEESGLHSVTDATNL